MGLAAHEAGVLAGPGGFPGRTRDGRPLTSRRPLPHTQIMKRDSQAGISPRTARYAAVLVAALVLAEIAATPFLGRG